MYRSPTTQNVSGLEFDFQGLNVKSDGAAGLNIYGFLLCFIVTYGVTRLLYKI